MSLDYFKSVPSADVFDTIYPMRLGMSLLLNGTRRWYIAEHFDSTPQDNGYFHDYLEKVLIKLAELLQLLAEHGIYRMFMPVYSWYQPNRDPTAHHYLLKGIGALMDYPRLLQTYIDYGFSVRFYGDTSHFPPELQEAIARLADRSPADARHHIYYGVDGGNPYEYSLKLAHQFSIEHGCAPSWADLVEMYYGNRDLKRLEILIGFNRLYSRGGIPHLLEGGDRIYATAVTPLVLSQTALRTILYDYLYNRQNHGRDYQDIHPNEVRRLKTFYAANQDSIMGVMRKYEDLVYPLPGIQWPEAMDN